jgi:hypothetical protein
MYIFSEFLDGGQEFFIKIVLRDNNDVKPSVIEEASCGEDNEGYNHNPNSPHQQISYERIPII